MKTKKTKSKQEWQIVPTQNKTKQKKTKQNKQTNKKKQHENNFYKKWLNLN